MNLQDSDKENLGKRWLVQTAVNLLHADLIFSPCSPTLEDGVHSSPVKKK
jgi:hypothetical protein